MSRDLGDMRLLTTPSAKPYASKVYAGILPLFEDRYRIEFPRTNPLMDICVSTFPNKEIDVQIQGSVRKRDVYACHSFTGYVGEFDPNIGFMQLSLLDDALRNATPESITYIVPYIPYQRQDRIDRPRVALSANRTARMFSDPDKPTRTHVVTFDMHSPQQQGFYAATIDNLRALPLFVDYCKNNSLLNGTLVVSPDVGGARRARDLASKLSDTEIFIIDKRRADGTARALNIVGPAERIKGSNVVIVDDMIDTGGTLVEAAHLLENAGAREVYAFATHGIFSPSRDGAAEERLRKSGMKVVVTDTIPRSESYYEENMDWLTAISTADMVSNVIYRLQRGLSITELYERWGF